MKPSLVTSEELAKTASSRWSEQYKNYPPDHKWALVARQLAELEAPTPEQVNQIIGHNGWTGLTCNGCDRFVNVAVRVGDAEDYDSRTAHLCPDCVREAAELVKEFK